MGEIMGKYEEVDRLKLQVRSSLGDKGFLLSPEAEEQVAILLYHREIGWKKIIQCLLWLRDIDVAEIHIEDISRASGKIEIRNYGGGKFVVGASRPVDKATR